MTDLVDRALGLWTGDVAKADDARERFAEVYTDPVVVNGTPMTLEVLIARAQAMDASLRNIRHEVLDVVEGDGFVAVAFRIHGRFAGPFALTRRSLAPTDQDVTLNGIDIFHRDDSGRIASLWAVSDPSDLMPAE